jgi:hypothetical protein
MPPFRGARSQGRIVVLSRPLERDLEALRREQFEPLVYRVIAQDATDR